MTRDTSEQKEKLRRELVERHVRNIEEANYVSLKFQEKLIENSGSLDDKTKEYIRSFLRPEDLEEISVERAEIGKCGWLQCRRKIPKDPSNVPKNHWKLDKEQGEIIDAQILCLFCSTNCYYSYINLSMNLSESPPHMRIQVLLGIKEWLNIENVDFNSKLSANTQFEGLNNEEKNGVRQGIKSKGGADVSSSSDLKIRVGPDNKKIENSQGKEKSSDKIEDDKRGFVLQEKKDKLIQLLNGLRAFRKSESNDKEIECIKQFEYLNINDEYQYKNEYEDDDNYTFKNPIDVLKLDKNFSVKNRKKTNKNIENNKEYNVLEDECGQNFKYFTDKGNDEYSENEDSESDTEEEKEEDADDNEDDEEEDCVLLMLQFYDNLSPEVVVYDLLTSLITKETKFFIAGQFSDTGEQSRREDEGLNKLTTIQNERRNILKDNVSLYINSIDWTKCVSKLSYTIYKVIDTFIFPFPIPNFRESCIELFTFIVIEIIFDKRVNNMSLDIFEEELKYKFNNWFKGVSEKYDGKFIQNTKLLFEE